MQYSSVLNYTRPKEIEARIGRECFTHRDVKNSFGLFLNYLCTIDNALSGVL